LTLYLKLTYC